MIVKLKAPAKGVWSCLDDRYMLVGNTDAYIGWEPPIVDGLIK